MKTMIMELAVIIGLLLIIVGAYTTDLVSLLCTCGGLIILFNLAFNYFNIIEE